MLKQKSLSMPPNMPMRAWGAADSGCPIKSGMTILKSGVTILKLGMAGLCTRMTGQKIDVGSQLIGGFSMAIGMREFA